MTRDFAELESLRAALDDYRRHGYTVVEQPAGSDLPPLLKEFQPDALAFKGDEKVVIEVKQAHSVVQSEIVRLAERVEQMPGWRFDLAVVPDTGGSSASTRTPLYLSDVSAPQTIVGRIRAAQTVSDAGDWDAALLLAWTAFEGALLRSAFLSDIELHSRDRTYLIQTLVSEGVLSRAIYEPLQESLRLRNRIAHGNSGDHTVAAELTSVLVATTKQLLTEEDRRVSQAGGALKPVRVVEQHDVRYVEARRLFDPTRLKHIYLVQATDSPSTLCAIGVRKDLAVFFLPGNMSFHSTGGGTIALEQFAAWVRAHRIPVSLSAATRESIDRFLDAPVIDLANLYRNQDPRAAEEFERLFAAG